ncbi:hypothetical protein K435DRAFT_777602 [Dendrothele bispora CBS 962.96]|uniref:Heterokaryon incompatibility domain-containing protein n=1 Tax=Dendrothele bispora (strain CBS 962.96) TaxID=1314807 RepID=A0A4S8M7D0_DENBC|nr:hypothetical protein K435DRAFT_777602 [Dendrothele bispora CBS 962.96]
MRNTDYYSLSQLSTSTVTGTTACSFVPKRSSLARLFREDPGVKGCGWFAPYREQRFHVLGNVIRVLFHVIFAPLASIPFGDALGNAVYNFVRRDWFGERLDTPHAVLRYPPPSTPLIEKSLDSGSDISLPVATSDPDVYESLSYKPRWMLEVTIRNGQYTSHKQINWVADEVGPSYRYTAISYDMESASELFSKAGKHAEDPSPEGKKWSLADRKRISKQLLIEYCSANRDRQVPLDRTEFIWLDEFCVSEEGEGNSYRDADELRTERKEELGRLTDIFRGAHTVVVFCQETGCDHTTLGCRWGQRLFTLGEILHANKVQRMTRKTMPGKDAKSTSFLYSESAQSFRERMMHHAAQANKWHLHALLRQSNNSGSETWQSAIHALMVEAIRRDKETKYRNHELLAQGLNGLLPRRAHVRHLTGKDGWADLSWLLELNQGFYNMATLAAVCSLNDSPKSGNGWLGPPVEPKAGQERLEPLVTAFPMVAKEETTCLNIVGAENIGLYPSPRRDGKALYRNPALMRMKIISTALLVTSWITGIILLIVALAQVFQLIPQNFQANPSSNLAQAGGLLMYLSSIVFVIFRLITGTWHLERNGWVFLSEGRMNDGQKGDLAWGSRPELVLGQIDDDLGTLAEWGERQMAPKWDSPTGGMKGHLVDLRAGIKVRVVVTGRPNSMVVLALHGSGVTYMLLNRPRGVGQVAEKLGMANLPPFTLAITKKGGSVRVGIASESPEKKKGFWSFLWSGNGHLDFRF